MDPTRRNESIFWELYIFYVRSNQLRAWVCKRETVFSLSFLIMPMASKSTVYSE